MPKLKTPLFSLSARGTLANSLTFRHRKHLDVVTTVPTHPDANTPAQRRHRFLYRLGIALWNGMTNAQRAAYAALAVGHSVSGMNVWLREWLTTTPYLTLALPLQEGTGSKAVDIGPHHDHFTLFGPSWVSPLPDHGLLADGLDDYTRAPSTADAVINSAEYTIMARCTRMSGTAEVPIINTLRYNQRGYTLSFQSLERIFLYTNDTGGMVHTSTVINVVPLGTPYIITARRNSDGDGTIHINKVDRTAATDAKNPGANQWAPTLFARGGAPVTFGPLHLYWLLIFSRALTIAEINAINNSFG